MFVYSGGTGGCAGVWRTERDEFVGRNTAIKQFDASPAGQPMELFDDARARVPVLIELLKSPWLIRASDLVFRDGGSATKRVEEPVTVQWDPERQCPRWFTREREHYRVDEVIQVWATERRWWDPRHRISRRFFRVLAGGGVYDVAFDQDAGGWLLIGVQD